MAEYEASSHGRRLTLRSCAVTGPRGPMGPGKQGAGLRATKNDELSVSQMLGVARSYYLHRGTEAAPFFRYNQRHTALDSSYYDKFWGILPADHTAEDAADWIDPGNIDCSTFIGLMLRGIPFELSPYAYREYLPPAPEDPDSESDDDPDQSQDQDDGDEKKPETYGWHWDHELPNGYRFPDRNPMYNWSIDLYQQEMEESVGGEVKPIRNTGQMAEWMENQGWAIEMQPGFRNLQPGDIVFWAKTGKDGNFIRKNRYRNISHVAVCYSVMDAPADVTVSAKTDVTVSALNVATAKAWLESNYHDYVAANANATFLISYANNVWTISRKTVKLEGVWQYGDTKTISLADIGVTATVSGTTGSFKVSRFIWDHDTYPFKHTTMEVTTGKPYVLNQTLEKNRPNEVCLICRPDLSVRTNEFVGNLTSKLGVDNLDNLYKDGDYYLFTAFESGLPEAVANGYGWSVRVWSTTRAHGAIYSITQELYRTNGVGPIYRRSKYCYSKPPEDATNLWTAWAAYLPIPDGGDVGDALVKVSDTELGWREIR